MAVEFLLLDLHDEHDTGERPLGAGRFGAQTGGEHVGVASSLRLVHGASEDAALLLLVDQHGSRADDGQGGVHLARQTLLHQTSLPVPASALHVQTADVCAVASTSIRLLHSLASHVGLEAEKNERQGRREE